jgi:hypothetical protein
VNPQSRKGENYQTEKSQPACSHFMMRWTVLKQDTPEMQNSAWRPRRTKTARRIIAIALGVESQDLRNQFVGNMLSQSYDAMGLGLSSQAFFSTMASAKNKTSGSTLSIIHRVQKGDTLYGIAKIHGCSIAQLKSWNRLQGNVIKPGQQLKIYHKSGSLHASAPNRRFNGDLLQS